MGLFQKNPFATTNQQPFYTLSLHRSVLIVGLGNKGKKYHDTRHNIGFAAVEALAEALDMPSWIEKKDLRCQLAIGNVGDTRVIICKPTTYMNNSGEAVRAVTHFYKLQREDIVVVHDEVDINFGQIRCRIGGSSAGHNGIKSVIEHIDEDFGRVRIGVGPKQPAEIDSADFVLAKFNADEKKQKKPLLRETSAVLTEFISTGELPHETRNFLT